MNVTTPIDHAGAGSRTPVLSVDPLGVRYGALVALQDVSWDVHAGELLSIIGPNGAGKSSCFDAVTALIARSGRVHLHGKAITAAPPYRLASLGAHRTVQRPEQRRVGQECGRQGR